MKIKHPILICLVVTVAFAVPAMAQEKSADEVAKELANPNNSLASLTFKNQYRWYTGDLPGADDQDNYTLLFQPVFPFPLDPTANGGKPNIFMRPAFPILFNQPVPVKTNGQLDWDEVSALGDIGFDLAYGVTEKNGLLWAVGMVGTLPTATDSAVAGKQLRLGPEALFAKFEKWGIWGLFPSDYIPDITFTADGLQTPMGAKIFPDGGYSAKMGEKGVPTPAPYQIVAALVDKMLENGYSEEDCGKFLGGNMYRVMKQVWF